MPAYFGGKTRLAGEISEVILRVARARLPALEPDHREDKNLAALTDAYREPSGRYAELFVGGGSILAAVSRLNRRFADPDFAAKKGWFREGLPLRRMEAGDLHPDLILMYQALQTGWTPPETLSDAQWYALKRETEPSALRGFAGFFCSFAGQWMNHPAHNSVQNPTGMVDKCPQARASTLKTAPFWASGGPGTPIIFRHRHYEEWTDSLRPGDTIYLDPPYAGTKGYAGVSFNGDGTVKQQVAETDFDHGYFWSWCGAMARRGVRVLVSEAQESEMARDAGFATCWGRRRVMGRNVSLGWRDSERILNADGVTTRADRSGGEEVVDRILCPLWLVSAAMTGTFEADVAEPDSEEDSVELLDSEFPVSPETFPAPVDLSSAEVVETCSGCTLAKTECVCDAGEDLLTETPAILSIIQGKLGPLKPAPDLWYIQSLKDAGAMGVEPLPDYALFENLVEAAREAADLRGALIGHANAVASGRASPEDLPTYDEAAIGSALARVISIAEECRRRLGLPAHMSDEVENQEDDQAEATEERGDVLLALFPPDPHQESQGTNADIPEQPEIVVKATENVQEEHASAALLRELDAELLEALQGDGHEPDGFLVPPRD